MRSFSVKYSKLKKIVDILKQRGTKANDDVSFEFIVGSLFPEILTNIKEEMKHQHAQGYIEGLEEGKKV